MAASVKIPISCHNRRNLAVHWRRGTDCSTSSSKPIVEGPWCRLRREARSRRWHQHWCSEKSESAWPPVGRL